MPAMPSRLAPDCTARSDGAPAPAGAANLLGSVEIANTPMNARSRHHAVAGRRRPDAINGGNGRTYTYTARLSLEAWAIHPPSGET
jgi:hypothetical protein